LPFFFPRFRAEFEHLPFRDGQFDAVVFNASFHYAENFELASSEAMRCCKPGGMLIVCDTPWYRSDDCGKRAIGERRAAFQRDYGTSFASIENEEYLTDERLRSLEKRLETSWIAHLPQVGLKWGFLPVLAKLGYGPEPARFYIHVARK